MNLTALLQLYSQKSFIKEVTKKHEQNPGHKTWIKNTKGSLKSLIGACIFQSQPQNSLLFILSDRENAQYFQNDLQTFLDKKPVLFYPSPFHREINFMELDTQSVLERTEVLNKIKETKNRSHIIVTYPEALFEKVINQVALKENTFDVGVGDKLDIDFIIEFLVSYNFERTDFL